MNNNKSNPSKSKSMQDVNSQSSKDLVDCSNPSDSTKSSTKTK